MTMGVPRLFGYVCTFHKQTIKTITIGRHTTYVTNLYIDGNALIHRAAQVVFAYGSYKPLIPACDKNMPYEEKTKLVFETVWNYLCDIVQTVTPRRLLYIAIDGCAPSSKMAQQRQRRFISARDTNSINTNEKMWNSSCITPGTLFMWELTKFINYSIRKMMLYDSTWKNLKIIFNPHNVPGEGEHKIVSYIRSVPQAEEMSHCLWGPDGDLIMLGLAIKCPRFLWFREDNNNPSRAALVDIGQLSHRISSRWSTHESFRDNCIDDFILVGFFVGNDFLPKIAMFYLLEEGFFIMIKKYKELALSLTKDGYIDITNFSQFIRLLSEKEEEFLEKQLDVVPSDERFINGTLKSCSTKSQNRFVIDYDLYRKKYYDKFNFKKSELSFEEKIDVVCGEYIKGLHWVFKYYINECPSYEWYYPYHYAPLMKDFYLYLSKGNGDILNMCFMDPTPFCPFEQLLSVLPPQCSNLLPSPYKKLFTDEDSPLKQYYPLEFDVDYEGVNKEYQGKALLPFVHPLTIRHIYEIAKSKDKKKRKRNQMGKVRTFITDGNTNYTYKSVYGNLVGCNVKVS